MDPMDETKKQRGIHVTFSQKKKLIEFITKHPQLITCKVTEDFSYKDSQKLWQSITNDCNSLPGARKSWKQWRKTWQDLRSNTKKRQAEINGHLPNSVLMLTPTEQAVLGLNLPSAAQQKSSEFVSHDQDSMENGNFNDEVDSTASISEPESPPEVKVFTKTNHKKLKVKNNRNNSKHSNKCYFNCDLLAIQEQKKIKIKEDYLNFKKDYLRQKLKLIKEQTAALKTIAKELSDM